MEEQNVETIKMVERALSVLDVLRTERRSMGVNEIAKHCSISPSTAFRILKTLELNGWVFQGGDSRYVTGQKLSFVLEKNNFFLAIKEVAAFTMNRYSQEYKQAMNLIVRDGSNCHILQQSRTKSLVDYVPPLYSSLPFYACAGGKILLSELSDLLVDQLLKSCEMVPLTPHTITTPEAFRKEIQEVANQGYAFDDRESSENGYCIAVPVRDNHKNIIAALSFSGFIGLSSPQSLLAYLPALNQASQEISHNLYRCWED